MKMFQSEWLREPAHPVPGSYTRPSYGMRYARAAAPVDIPIDLPAPRFPPREGARTPALSSFDRAA